MSLRGHTSAPRGKRVLVVMKNGNHVIAKFKAHTDRVVQFFDHEDIDTIDVRTLSIYREPQK